MADMTEFIQKTVSKLGIRESGYRLITNIGSDGGQEVPHLHFHIIGGEPAGKLVR
jgi:histidine triad (HIT) family protein